MTSIDTDKLVSIIDIGSNSIRMVIYDEFATFPRVVLDEKAECHLAEGIAQTGKFKPKNVEKALVNIRRFAALLDTTGVEDEEWDYY